MRDETLADIASHPPKTQGDLAKVRGLSAAWKDNDIGKRLMKVLADHGYQTKLQASSTDSNIPMSLGIPAITIGSGGGGGRNLEF